MYDSRYVPAPRNDGSYIVGYTYHSFSDRPVIWCGDFTQNVSGRL